MLATAIYLLGEFYLTLSLNREALNTEQLPQHRNKLASSRKTIVNSRNFAKIRRIYLE